jgi:transmembrane sensor
MSRESAAPLSDAVRAEAAAWVARLHGSGRSRALESGLRVWLQDDPAHARAFEIATEAWEIAGSVPAAALPRLSDLPDVSPRARAARHYIATIASVLVVLIGALLFDRWQSPPISTAVGEQRMLTLKDGTRIYLNTDTRLFVQQDTNQRRVRLESGEALFDVAKDPQRPFVVAVGDKQVVALGTSFVIRRDVQRLTVTLMEGKVTVAPLTSGRIQSVGTPLKGEKAGTLLKPGERLTIVNRDPPKIDAPSLVTITAWRRGEIVFDNTRLQDAVADMNRYNATQLIVDAPQAADLPISGLFRAGDSARFAQAISEIYHLTVTTAPQRIIISGEAH